MKRFYLLLLALAVMSASAQETRDLRVEGLTEPLAIDNVSPHFSWKITSAKPFQPTAYEIEVASDSVLLQRGEADMWKSGPRSSQSTVMVPYEGKALSPRSLYYWRVKSHSQSEATPWSPCQRFGVGIIAPDQMRSQFIGMGLGQGKAVLVGKTFRLRRTNGTALLHVNSLGYHEVWINGQKVTQAVLTPAVSQLNKRSLIVTYDVSPHLQRGMNSILLWIGSGWYKKETFGAQYDGPAVRAELDLLTERGLRPLLQTDSTWMGRESGYEDLGRWLPGQFGGERIDARLVPSQMNCVLRGEGWKPVQRAVIDSLPATPQMCQLNAVKEVLTPAHIEDLGGGRWLVDMGRILNGFFELHTRALPQGHQITAAYNDQLRDLAHFRHSNFGEDIYIASGREGGDTFCNRFNHHLFRYVLLSGLDEAPQKEDLRAYRIGMDVEVNGTFVSADNDLNQIYNLVTYTMDNLLWGGYMVDCASVERLGYGGDGNASTLTLQNTFDVAPLYMNWLQAWNDAIQPNGSVPHTAPNPYNAGGGPYWCSFIVQAPWRTWWNFGDDRLLHRCYDKMRLWLSYVDTYTREGLLRKWPDEPLRNWYLGDWLAPAGINVNDPQSVDLVNNCALSQSYAELIQIAEQLGKPADKQEFERRRTALNKRIHQVFFHPESMTYATGSQLDMSYPLLVGAVPQEYVKAITQKLLSGRDHLGVGLVGVPVLTEWATLTGQADFMYRMLKQRDYPGYLYMIHQGATGNWENWKNPRSALHNCFNGIGSWFYQALGGIIPTSPGYQTVSIAPQYPQGLEWVRVTRETPYGTLRVSWKQEKGKTLLHVEIPTGITATIDGQTFPSGNYDFTKD